MVITKVKISTIILLIISFCLFVSCKKESKISNKSNVSLPKIEGFYIFKQNMSFKDVSNILTDNKIKFRIVNLNNIDEVNYPLSGRYLISANDLKHFKNIKIIEGFNLTILDKNLERFQICFFNDTIFYFNYRQNLEDEYIPNQNNKGNYALSKKSREDLDLLKTLSEGLNHKYGNPNIDVGSLNAIFPSTPPSFEWNNEVSKGKQYSERQIWFGKDSVTHIRLENDLIKDTLKLEPYRIKTQILTDIEVLFNSKYADEIEKFISKKDSLEEIMKKKSVDSLEKEKKKQFDKL